MKTTTPHWIAISLLTSVLIFGALKVIVLGNTEKAEDGRTAVILEPAERQAVLGEMRVLLETTQTIVEALANDDLAAVEAAARPIGSAAIATVDFRLRAKLPLAFKQLGFGTHYAFDDIANMAKEGKPAKAIQQKLAATMDNCIACHASFQLPTAPVKQGE
ncbi:MAG: hypothetical protein COW18_06510 [Zetaproteobacteria bacterium CG12_big_fil_rev_8_21_14_0_65_54_13]|nr:MAG: hypothetical protein COX55_06925 [Zetaproteobacteria bacterium CG23_combo_of_CG06-09_8_20_14_all_54_7]PIW48756.1 MAG: hypothetical protein COW18_06510 [Zetaproteobacteria bacterium CG12_big_fil_rev_8_21_14_0_65_54_13]PIX53237.1 MAG: hypothetical protein COZ50_14450 [Zetaproteobacteria bacterium CG_4_10_14_3_um_filter_54_28]PJA30572.1 MAG: hypothetical protein CO188_02855 [Zetaproteobacteria bacterium CG_4_9_14_3_um_filter_54_145]